MIREERLTEAKQKETKEILQCTQCSGYKAKPVSKTLAWWSHCNGVGQGVNLHLAFQPSSVLL